MTRTLGFRYRKLRVFVTDLEALASLPLDASRIFEFVWIHDEVGVRHIAQVAPRKKFESYVARMQRTLAEGGRIAVALEAGKPVAWQMLRPREQVTIPWLRVRANDAVFSFGSYTVCTWRGHRLMTHLTKFAAATYAGQKFRRLCSMAEPNNRNAMRAREDW
jgi:hypothetical protein